MLFCFDPNVRFTSLACYPSSRHISLLNLLQNVYHYFFLNESEGTKCWCLDGEKIMLFFDPVKFLPGYCFEGDKITFLFDSIKFPYGFSFLGGNMAFSSAPLFCLEGEKTTLFPFGSPSPGENSTLTFALPDCHMGSVWKTRKLFERTEWEKAERLMATTCSRIECQREEGLEKWLGGD